jgi:hypothetical protein
VALGAARLRLGHGGALLAVAGYLVARVLVAAVTATLPGPDVAPLALAALAAAAGIEVLLAPLGGRPRGVVAQPPAAALPQPSATPSGPVGR